MRLGFLFLVGFCAACSLNPQPFPPDTVDGGSDATLMGAPEAGGGDDSGSFGDSGKGPDADIDAESDAGLDAAEDASEDASLDARDDG